MLRHRRWPPPAIIAAARRLSGLPPPPVAPVICVSNNIASLGKPKGPPKPTQLLSLPRFPAADPLPGRKPSAADPFRHRVTAISWVKHYFQDVAPEVIQTHFTKGLIKHNEAMVPGMKIHIPVSVAEAKIAKRYDTIPTATLYPNADEISYLQRLVIYKDSAIMVLNKPPKVPVKGNLPVHNSMDVLAAAALSYGNAEGPKLVHRLVVDGEKKRKR